jgi:hypothetical protein
LLSSGMAEAAAIADPSEECLQEALRLAPEANGVSDLDALIGEDVDGIVIATPSAQHAEQAIWALRSGVAGFCQKPLGRTAVAQLVPSESHIPERAQKAVPALSVRKPIPFPRPRGYGDAPSRPLHLLACPEPIEAMAPLPDEPPVLFRWRRVLHKVAKVDGPERLAPEWWRSGIIDQDARTRDYFAVEDEDRARFWLFREGLYLPDARALPRWYLHGLFA